MCVSVINIIMTQIVPHHLANSIPWHHPWPFEVTRYSAWMVSWTWWLLFAIPICSILSHWQQNHSILFSIATFTLGILVSLWIPSVKNIEQSIFYSLVSFFILANALLSHHSFSAMHLGLITIEKKEKQRHHARQVQQALLISSLFSTTILAIGGDFLFWSLGIGLCTLLVFIWLCCFSIAFNRECHGPT